jgi:hypothetical protein
MQAVAGFGRLAVADAIGQYHEIAADIEWLAGAEQLAGKFRTHELGATATSAVKNEHGVTHNSALIAPRLAEGAVVDAQRRYRFPGRELKIIP